MSDTDPLGFVQRETPLTDRLLELISAFILGAPPYSIEVSQSAEFITVTFTFREPSPT